MSLSCDQLSLRIALCDLVDRLKRSEQKCSYLERCRHELIREVMRLRIQNEWLSTNSNTCSNANHDLPTMLAVSGTHGNHSLLNTETDHKSNKSYENDSDAKEDGEESWEQITIRLLQDLKRDVQKARKAQSDGHHNESNITLKTIEEKLTDKNIDTQIEEEISRLAIENTAIDIDTAVEDISGLRTALTHVNTDLSQVVQALTQQNEKLNKLKAKQLRNYFKRQIVEQNFHQTSTPLKIDPKFNDENY